MINPASVIIENIAVHYIGNSVSEEPLLASEKPLQTDEEEIRDLLLTYLLGTFKTEEFFSFIAEGASYSDNPVFQICSEIFAGDAGFHLKSIETAKLLYNATQSANIKSGYLYVAHLNDIFINGETLDAVGIFKAETKQSFLQLKEENKDFVVRTDQGFSTDKLDKGCLVLNTNKDTGYKVLILDRSGRSQDGIYWKDDFLGVKPVADNFFFTKELLTVTKDFVTKELPEQYQIEKADQIDLLNRSVDYFKTQDKFNEQEFTESIFKDEGVIESFKKYKEEAEREMDFSFEEAFDISAPAVKKQSKVFKSVIKLDKNFHVYVHGNRELIEKGEDEDGRKYYKLYFKEEA